MKNDPSAVHAPFAGPVHQRDSAELAMWAVIAQELLFFAVLFVWYMVTRLRAPDEFLLGSRATDWRLGAAMTGLLLLSSATVVFALRFAVQRRRIATSVALGLSISLGFAFLVLKGIEYGDHIRAGQTPLGANGRFWSVYFVTTGMHVLHVFVGIGLLGIMLIRALSGRLRVNALIVSALFWHFVDIVWIFLFPLLYLISPQP
jgi:cytochrome c oxidase subunit 3